MSGVADLSGMGAREIVVSEGEVLKHLQRSLQAAGLPLGLAKTSAQIYRFSLAVSGRNLAEIRQALEGAASGAQPRIVYSGSKFAAIDAGGSFVGRTGPTAVNLAIGNAKAGDAGFGTALVFNSGRSGRSHDYLPFYGAQRGLVSLLIDQQPSAHEGPESPINLRIALAYPEEPCPGLFTWSWTGRDTSSRGKPLGVDWASLEAMITSLLMSKTGWELTSGLKDYFENNIDGSFTGGKFLLVCAKREENLSERRQPGEVYENDSACKYISGTTIDQRLTDMRRKGLRLKEKDWFALKELSGRLLISESVESLLRNDGFDAAKQF